MNPVATGFGYLHSDIEIAVTEIYEGVKFLVRCVEIVERKTKFTAHMNAILKVNL
jgi:hypothetical protein